VVKIFNKLISKLKIDDKLLGMVIKRIDPQGRVVLPKSIREKATDDMVVVVDFVDHVVIYPRGSDLSKYIDAVDVDVKSFEDYHELRREASKL